MADDIISKKTEPNTNPAPHLHADGSVHCVSCDRLLVAADGTVERDPLQVASRLVVPPIARLVQGKTAWEVRHVLICMGSDLCYERALRDPRWIKANMNGYDSRIIIGGDLAPKKPGGH